MNKPRIHVWETASLGLIILYPSGVLVSNQTGGSACLRPEAEGIYVPLRAEAIELEQYFTGEPWNGACCNGIDHAAANRIDDYLTSVDHGALAFLSVNRQRLHESHEAWIYVNIEETPPTSPLSLFTGFGKASGILTFPNSD